MRLKDGVRVVDRGNGAVQVGVARPLVLEPTVEQRAWLERIDTTREISRRDAAAQPRLVERLDSAGLLQPAAARRAVVGIDGATALTVALAAALAADGITVCINDERPLAGAAPTLGATRPAATRQAGAAEAVRRLVPAAAVLTGPMGAEAWVIASDAAPRREVAAPLLARDTPHLFLVTNELGVEVGPLVIPGGSACGTCDALGRREADAAWPLVELGLSAPRGGGSRPRPDLVAIASGLAAAAIAGWRREDATPWLDARWLVYAGAAPVRVPVNPRADCGCGATASVGDHSAARRARW